jgi:phosphoribosylglycinamide formyltransferase-1
VTRDVIGQPLSLVVPISGRGSNLQAIIDAIGRGKLPAVTRAVISNRADAYGLERARLAGVPTEVLDHTRYSSRVEYDRALATLIDHYAPDAVVLAGFMRILGPEFVARYRGRLFNIHPSLLPELPGLDTHRRALQAGRREHGASVHFVTDEVDGGPVLIQASVPVHLDDTAETLADRVLAKEHILYPTALRWYAEGRVKLEGDTIYFDGTPLETPMKLPI